MLCVCACGCGCDKEKKSKGERDFICVCVKYDQSQCTESGFKLDERLSAALPSRSDARALKMPELLEALLALMLTQKDASYPQNERWWNYKASAKLTDKTSSPAEQAGGEKGAVLIAYLCLTAAKHSP